MQTKAITGDGASGVEAGAEAALAARQKALRELQILDTLPEQSFDDITLLASQICETPIALISLLESDRQWFKSKVGLDASETPIEQSFCVHAIQQPDVMVVPDALDDNRFADNPLVSGAPNIRFYAGAPLHANDGTALGALCVIDRKPRDLTAQQEAALQALARQVMAQFELRLHVLELSQHFTERRRIEAALRESEVRFKAFMDNSPAVAFMKDEAGRMVYVNQPFLRRFNLTPDEVLNKDDFDLWPEETARELRAHDLQVWAGDKIVDLIESVPAPDGHPEYWQVYKFILQHDERRLLAGLALDITENKRYQQQLEEYQRQLEVTNTHLQRLSLTDPLTGINNRRAFKTRLNDEVRRAARYDTPLSLVMLDVDHFKSYNDIFGHPAGDEVLCEVARLLSSVSRYIDFVARYGGEEFIVLLPNTDRAGALLLAERYRQCIADLNWPRRAITASLGVATWSATLDGDQTGDHLIERADAALYQAKAAGRNRVAESPER